VKCLENNSSTGNKNSNPPPETINLARDYPRDYPGAAALNQFEGRAIHQSLTQEECRAVKAFAQNQGVTVNAVLLSAFYLVLHLYSGDDDIVIGMPVTNRDHTEAYKIIGLLVNTLALRLQASDKLSLSQLIHLINQKVIRGLMHRDIPLEQLIENLQVPRNLNYQPLFQVMFNYIEEDIAQLGKMKDIEIELMDIPMHQSTYYFLID